METPEEVHETSAEESTSPPPEVEEGAVEESGTPAPKGDDATPSAETREELSEKVERRIAQLNARIGAGERAQERLRQENEELRKGNEKPPETTARPRRDDFESEEQYEDKLHDYWRRQDDKKRKADEEKRAKDQAQRDWEERMRPGYEKYEDFAEVYQMPLSQQMAEAIQATDAPVEIAYHLHQNRDVLQKLMNMTPAKAAREIHKLETQLTGGAPKPTGGAPPKKIITKAPPATHTVGYGSPPEKKKLESMTAKEFMDHRNREEQGRVDRGE
jgi:hypothetical protein